MENGQSQFAQCSNCQRNFPQDRIQLHEAYCSRNFHKCQKCGSMVDKNYLQQHQKQFHAVKKCEYCGLKYQVSQEPTHLQSCQSRPQLCDFCQIKYPKQLINQHIEACGSRTKQCNICRKLIPLKNYYSHLEKCADKIQRRERRQNSQNPKTQQQIQYNQHFQQRQLYRQNSTNQIKHLTNNLNRHEQIIDPHQGKVLERNQQRERELNRRDAHQRQIGSKEHNKGRAKIPKVKKKDFIAPEPIRSVIDPVPISVRIALKVKNKKQYQ